MDPIDLTTLRMLAESAARAGGEVSRAAFGRRQVVTLKPDSSEVTEIDVAAERAIVAHIRAARPDDEFIGEEGVAGGLHNTANVHRSAAFAPDAAPAPSANCCWAIDPIDGTRNFIRGVPLFTTSVAALRAGEPVAAAIFEPMTNAAYSAQRGGGAFLNGERLPQLSERAAAMAVRNQSRVVAIPSAWRRESGEFVRRVLETSVVRSLGSATHHLLHVAIGGADATMMNNCKIWDIAAGWLIVVECGGVCTYPDGRAQFPIASAHRHGAEMPTIAGTPADHQRLTDLWRQLSVPAGAV